MAKNSKPRFSAKRAVTEMLCDLPYRIRIDYSKAGQAGKVAEVKVPGHLVDVVVKEALQKAWAAGYAARMDQVGAVVVGAVHPKRFARVLASPEGKKALRAALKRPHGA